MTARLVDEKKGRFGNLQLPNSVQNGVEYRRAVEAWAQRLRLTLDTASDQSLTRAGD